MGHSRTPGRSRRVLRWRRRAAVGQRVDQPDQPVGGDTCLPRGRHAHLDGRGVHHPQPTADLQVPRGLARCAPKVADAKTGDVRVNDGVQVGRQILGRGMGFPHGGPALPPCPYRRCCSRPPAQPAPGNGRAPRPAGWGGPGASPLGRPFPPLAVVAPGATSRVRVRGRRTLCPAAIVAPLSPPCPQVGVRAAGAGAGAEECMLCHHLSQGSLQCFVCCPCVWLVACFPPALVHHGLGRQIVLLALFYQPHNLAEFV